MANLGFVLGIALFIILPIISFLFPSVKKAWGVGVFWLIMIFWLVPVYPLGYILAHWYPTDEACGIAGFCVSAILGLLVAFGWLILFPIIVSIIARINQKSNKNNQVNSEFQSETNEVFKPIKPGETFFHISDIWKS